MSHSRRTTGLLAISLISLLVLAALTVNALRPFPEHLNFANLEVRKKQILDRRYQPLTVTYQNDWNLHDSLPLHEIPLTFQQIFILVEDQRFYQHGGVDWRARLNAVVQNLRAGRIVRGASTMTEQAVRMLHPRPRTFWSRWVETFEAMQLEAQFSKAEILEFYLNQIHYANQRRGVVQAARYYFDRDLDTLSLKEMLALAILVRSPSRLDLRRGTEEIRQPMQHLAARLQQAQLISADDYQHLIQDPLVLKTPTLPVQATHFVNYLYRAYPQVLAQQNGRLHTTLDASLQASTQAILDHRLADLHRKGVQNGAVLIVDHHSRQILAWVNAGDYQLDSPGSQIDAVTIPRQPGSTLKPLLYAQALEQGWTAATLIDDLPLTEAVGSGMHNYRNYSRSYYGPLRLRDALGNSLNTPAVRTIQFVGASQFLKRLRELGVQSLTETPDFYGDGLALGNGGLTLFELVQAYAVLAGGGAFRPLQALMSQPSSEQERPVYSPEVSSLIANILSDSDARRLEFGDSTLLQFPVQTAVKTGTSNAYHDAWAVGFNHRYVVGVWLGNLDQQAMTQVSGATGPALVLRSLFAELNRHTDTRPLYLSPQLLKAEICRDSGLRADGQCSSRYEWFVPGHEAPATLAELSTPAPAIRLRQPTHGLQLAMDPRIPDSQEAFPLSLPSHLATRVVEWEVDNSVVGVTTNNHNRWDWPLSRGTHQAKARLWTSDSGERPLETPSVTFHVQ